MAKPKKKEKVRKLRKGLKMCYKLAPVVVTVVLALTTNIVNRLITYLAAAYMSYQYANIPTSTWRKDMYYFFKSSTQAEPALAEKTLQFEPGDDRDTQLCKLSLYTKTAEELHSGVIVNSFEDRRVTLPPAERCNAYVKACREVIAGLPTEVRKILDALDPVPSPWQFHLNVTHPWFNGRFTQPMWGGVDRPEVFGQAPGQEGPEGSEEKWRAQVEQDVAALPSIETRLKPQAELEKLPAAIVQGLRELGIRPVKDEVVDVADIPQAIREGRTAVFDATKLCGKDIFNLTVPDIARLHGQAADDIPALKSSSSVWGDGTFDSLAELAQRFKTWDEMGWQYVPNFGLFPDMKEVAAQNALQAPSDWVVDGIQTLLSVMNRDPKENVKRYFGTVMDEYRLYNTQTSINVKRLPRFPLKDMYQAMGSPGWVDRLWNLLWIGPVPDFWHFDEEDNLLICVSGTIYVAVMEQHVTNAISGTRNVGLGFNELMPFFRRRQGNESHWVDDHDWIRKVPLHIMKLEPGMGITVPSRTYHDVIASDANRLLMNCFFLPKWKAAEDAPAVMNSWYKPGTQADTYKAMLHLKYRSIWRLWDTQKIGGFFKGAKLEFF